MGRFADRYLFKKKVEEPKAGFWSKAAGLASSAFKSPLVQNLIATVDAPRNITALAMTGKNPLKGLLPYAYGGEYASLGEKGTEKLGMEEGLGKFSAEVGTDILTDPLTWTVIGAPVAMGKNIFRAVRATEKAGKLSDVGKAAKAAKLMQKAEKLRSAKTGMINVGVPFGRKQAISELVSKVSPKAGQSLAKAGRTVQKGAGRLGKYLYTKAPVTSSVARILSPSAQPHIGIEQGKTLDEILLGNKIAKRRGAIEAFSDYKQMLPRVKSAADDLGITEQEALSKMMNLIERPEKPMAASLGKNLEKIQDIQGRFAKSKVIDKLDAKQQKAVDEFMKNNESISAKMSKIKNQEANKINRVYETDPSKIKGVEQEARNRLRLEQNRLKFEEEKLTSRVKDIEKSKGELLKDLRKAVKVRGGLLMEAEGQRKRFTPLSDIMRSKKHGALEELAYEIKRKNAALPEMERAAGASASIMKRDYVDHLKRLLTDKAKTAKVEQAAVEASPVKRFWINVTPTKGLRAIGKSDIQRKGQFADLPTTDANALFKAKEGYELYKEDPVISYFTRQGESKVKLANADTIKKIVHEFGDKEVPGMSAIDFLEQAKMGNVVNAPGVREVLKDVNIPTDIVRYLNEQNAFWKDPERVSTVAAIWDAYMGLAKGSITAVAPAFHVRNAISNIMLAVQGGLSSPRQWIKSFRFLRGQDGKPIQVGNNFLSRDEFIKEAVSNGVLSRGIVEDMMGELGQGAEEFKNIEQLMQGPKAFSLTKAIPTRLRDIPQSFREVTRGAKYTLTQPFKELSTKRPGGLVQDFAKRGYSAAQEAMRVGRDVGSEVENLGRLALAFDQIGKGVTDWKEIGKWVNKHFFDYSDLTRFEKSYLRRYVTFYTFARKNLPLQLEYLVKRPQDMANIGRITQMNRPESDEGLPNWISEGIYSKAGTGKQGLPLLMHGLGLPQEEALKRLSLYEGFSPQRALQKIGGTLAPPIKAGMEFMSGKDFFTGGDLLEMDKAYPWMEKLNAVPGGSKVLEKLKFRSYTGPDGVERYRMDPYIAFVLRQPPFSRIMNDFLNKPSDKNKKLFHKILDMFTGIKITTVDPEQQAYYDISSKQKEIEEEIKRSGLGSVYKIPYVYKTAKETPEGAEMAERLKGVRSEKKEARERLEKKKGLFASKYLK